MKNETFGSLYAVDDLGRKLPGAAQVGERREDRYVGMFYFLTHGARGGDLSKVQPVNVTEILEKHPEAVYEYDHPAWGKGGPMYWGEPLYGHYFTDDEWVIRKHVEMLTAADVDFLIFDTTNRVTFFKQVSQILKVLDEYRQAGWKVPQVVYYTNTQSGATVKEVYDDVYKKGLYPELWFMWEGKPLMIGEPSECDEEIRDFFTFRICQWPTEAKKELGFPWIDFERPQRVWNGPDGKPEVVPVSIAQHPNISFGDAAFYGEASTRGRSFHDHRNDHTPDAYKYGYNVSEQWERALAVDPKIVFFTGWNEWTAGRMHGNADRPVLMIDQADMEYSRDIEPMRGGFFDNYYMQFCDYVRRFKGAYQPVAAGEKKTIDLQGSFDQWDEVSAAYYDMPFATLPRNHAGYGVEAYKNETGRNEINLLKMARDDENIYFYARTDKDIEFNMFTQWMLLYIGVIGREYAPHWHGFHYLLNEILLNADTTFLQTCKGGYRWGDNTRVSYRREGNQLQICIPRKLLGIAAGAPFAIHFKWADHAGTDHTIEDFYEHGDTAPFGRFSFIYEG